MLIQDIIPCCQIIATEIVARITWQCVGLGKVTCSQDNRMGVVMVSKVRTVTIKTIAVNASTMSGIRSNMTRNVW